MSLFSKLFGGPTKRGPVEEAPAVTTEATPLPSELLPLTKALAPDGTADEEIVQLLVSLRRSPLEGLALETLLRRAGGEPLPDRIAMAVASILVDRGETQAADAVLAHVATAEALVTRADLRAARGEVPQAIALVERALLRSFDYPGARERHARWRAALGVDGGKLAAPEGNTIVTASPESPFTILREVARGGAGAVYEAEDTALGRIVALKVYHDPVRGKAQLLHEARVASALAGRGVLRVFDVDPEHGWLALEWSPRGAVREAIRGGRTDLLLPVTRWLLPLASALARTHAAGWVHLDVKPANVLFANDRTALLSDFGIAQRTGDPNAPGSLGYASPERVAGAAASPSDDVYGFGRLLEDVLEALAAAGHRGISQAFHPLATVCTGPFEMRPSDGRALVTRIRTELLPMGL